MKSRLLFILHLFIVNSIYSQVGALDTSFGNNGIVITDPTNNLTDDDCSSVTVKDNGSILVTGFSINTNGNKDITLVQYDSNGLLDNSFGNGGIVTLDINNTDNYGTRSVYTSDGKILTTGYSANLTLDIIVCRFNPDGSLDNTFGTNGIFTFDYDSGGDLGIGLALQSDGKIIVGSRVNDATPQMDVCLLRLNVNGTLDLSFGINGIVIFDNGRRDSIWDLKILNNNKFFISGISTKIPDSNNDTTDYFLIKFNQNGEYDLSFNSTGIVVSSYQVGALDAGLSISIQDDEKIVICGYSNFGIDPDDFGVARYNADGSIDISFGSNGVSIIDLGSSYDLPFSSLIQNDGKIIIGGYRIDATTYNFDVAIIRLTSDGTLDSNFGTNGIVLTDIDNSSFDRGYSLSFQNENTFLMAGSHDKNGDDRDLMVIRYLLEDEALSINDINSNFKNFKIYPNPTSDIVKLNSSKLSGQKVNINIYSNTGKRVRTIKNLLINDLMTIDIREFKKGIYFFNIFNDKLNETYKLILN